MAQISNLADTFSLSSRALQSQLRVRTSFEFAQPRAWAVRASPARAHRHQHGPWPRPMTGVRRRSSCTSAPAAAPNSTRRRRRKTLIQHGGRGGLHLRAQRGAQYGQVDFLYGRGSVGGSEATQSKRVEEILLGSRHAAVRTSCFKEAARACCTSRPKAHARQDHRQGSAGYHCGRAGPLARLLRAAGGRGADSRIRASSSHKRRCEHVVMEV